MIKFLFLRAIVKECVQPYFILDGEIQECPSFNEKFIHEGTAVYEVVRLIEDKLLFVQDHLQRLSNSLNMAGIQSWITPAEIYDHLHILVDQGIV